MAIIFTNPGTDLTGILVPPFTATALSNGTVTSDATKPKHGSRSIKCTTTAVGGQALVYVNGTLADAGRAISVWVMFSTVTPSTNTMCMEALTSNAGSSILCVGISTTGKLTICGRGAAGQSGATTLVANVWYRITFAYIITTSSNWSATVYLNGVSEVTTSNTDGTLSATATNALGFGMDASASVASFTSAAAMTTNIDSIYVDDRTDKTDPGDYFFSPSFKSNNLRPRAFAPGNEGQTGIAKFRFPSSF